MTRSTTRRSSGAGSRARRDTAARAWRGSAGPARVRAAVASCSARRPPRAIICCAATRASTCAASRARAGGSRSPRSWTRAATARSAATGASCASDPTRVFTWARSIARTRGTCSRAATGCVPRAPRRSRRSTATPAAPAARCAVGERAGLRRRRPRVPRLEQSRPGGAPRRAHAAEAPAGERLGHDRGAARPPAHALRHALHARPLLERPGGCERVHAPARGAHRRAVALRGRLSLRPRRQHGVLRLPALDRAPRVPLDARARLVAPRRAAPRVAARAARPGRALSRGGGRARGGAPARRRLGVDRAGRGLAAVRALRGHGLAPRTGLPHVVPVHRGRGVRGRGPAGRDSRPLVGHRPLRAARGSVAGREQPLLRPRRAPQFLGSHSWFAPAPPACPTHARRAPARSPGRRTPANPVRIPGRAAPFAAPAPRRRLWHPPRVPRVRPEAPMPSRRRAFLVLLLCIAVGVLVLNLAIGMRRPLHATIAPRVLVFDVPGQVDEGPPPPTLSFDFLRRERPTFHELLFALRNAADDRSVTGLVLHVDGLDWGWARVYEMSDAVRAFRASGKPGYASLDGAGGQGCLLAAAPRAHV